MSPARAAKDFPQAVLIIHDGHDLPGLNTPLVHAVAAKDGRRIERKQRVPHGCRRQRFRLRHRGIQHLSRRIRGGGVVIERHGKGDIRILALPASAEVETEVPVSAIGRVWRPQAVNRRAKLPPDWSALLGVDRCHVADRAMCPAWSTFPALAPPTPAKRGRGESEIARIRQAS